MTAPLGRALILLALLVSTAGAFLGFALAEKMGAAGVRWMRRATYLFAGLMAAANLLMIYALLARDFSVSYVAHVGSRSVPNWVAVVSLWSSLEGSILFWGLVLGAFMAAATRVISARHPESFPVASAVWLACGAFFSFLLAGPAQPFQSISPVPLDGPGPNPLLQNHLLMVIHPPFLYLGYVGMTIPFGLASAALLRRRLGPDLMRSLRTWLMVPWMFLSVAIVLGGWWAYEVLGWGGYWAWDPVENAALLPWLTATAALHSALLVQRRGLLKGWTVTLVLATFLLTILGTFMTRSGVFNSVHSFTQSPIGPTILVFLAAVLIWSLVLLALRLDSLAAEGSLVGGREGAFLVNNLLLVLLTFTVLIGTVFPLVVDALRGIKISVGRPYFDTMAVPIGVALLLLMGVGPALPWGATSWAQARRVLLPPIAGGAVGLVIAALIGARAFWALATLFLAGYVLHVTIVQLWQPVRQRMRAAGESAPRAAWEAHIRRGRRRLGAYVVHVGVVLIIVGVSGETMRAAHEIRLERGQSTTAEGYGLTFQGTDLRREPQRESTIVQIAVTREGHSLGVLEPRMNQYDTQREPIGTPAVHTTPLRDLYLSIVSIDPAGQWVALNVIVNPLVVWIWTGMLVIAFGALVALIPGGRVALAASGSQS